MPNETAVEKSDENIGDTVIRVDGVDHVTIRGISIPVVKSSNAYHGGRIKLNDLSNLFLRECRKRGGLVMSTLTVTVEQPLSGVVYWYDVINARWVILRTTNGYA